MKKNATKIVYYPSCIFLLYEMKLAGKKYMNRSIVLSLKKEGQYLIFTEKIHKKNLFCLYFCTFHTKYCIIIAMIPINERKLKLELHSDKRSKKSKSRN